MHTDEQILQTLEHAMKPIINEMYQNGTKEGCRIWEDPSHPLSQAIAILLKARTQVPSLIKEAAALLEQHRRLEEGM